MLKAKLVIPKTEKRIVWIGLYGGHYDAIVFFKKKPKLIKGDDPDSIRHSDCYDTTHPANKDLIIGCMYLSEFEFIYPDLNLIPEDTDIVKVHKMELEAIFDKYGDLVSIGNFHADGY